MTHKQLLGSILISVGEQLCNEKSKLAKSIEVSESQLFSIVKFARILTSPSVQVYYIADLADKYHKSVKTIQSWIADGYIRKGHKRKHDTRMFWYASELDEDEKILKANKMITPRSKVMESIARCRRFLCFKDCGEE